MKNRIEQEFYECNGHADSVGVNVTIFLLDSDFSAKEVPLWALFRNPGALPWGATLVFIYIAKFIIPRDESSSSLLGVLDSLDPLGTRRRGELWLGTPVTWPRGLKIPESVSVVSVITHSSRETSKLDKIEDWQDKEPFEWRLKFSIVMKFQVFDNILRDYSKVQ